MMNDKIYYQSINPVLFDLNKFNVSLYSLLPSSRVSAATQPVKHAAIETETSLDLNDD